MTFALVCVQRMIGEHKWISPTTLYSHNTSHFSGNRIENCSIRFAEASPLLLVRGNGVHIENNDLSWNDWSTVSAAPCHLRRAFSSDQEKCDEFHFWCATSTRGDIDPAL